jgi:hypothetical protein
MNQINSDGSDPHRDPWEFIAECVEYAKDAAALFGVFCAALLVGTVALRIFN